MLSTLSRAWRENVFFYILLVKPSQMRTFLLENYLIFQVLPDNNTILVTMIDLSVFKKKTQFHVSSLLFWQNSGKIIKKDTKKCQFLSKNAILARKTQKIDLFTLPSTDLLVFNKHQFSMQNFIETHYFY